MGKVLMTEDFTFNMTGAESGRVEKEAGETFEGADWMCEKLVNHWEVARWHETGPKQTKQQESRELHLIHSGGGWYDIIDENDTVVANNIHGRKKAEAKMSELL